MTRAVAAHCAMQKGQVSSSPTAWATGRSCPAGRTSSLSSEAMPVPLSRVNGARSGLAIVSLVSVRLRRCAAMVMRTSRRSRSSGRLPCRRLLAHHRGGARGDVDGDQRGVAAQRLVGEYWRCTEAAEARPARTTRLTGRESRPRRRRSVTNSEADMGPSYPARHPAMRPVTRLTAAGPTASRLAGPPAGSAAAGPTTMRPVVSAGSQPGQRVGGAGERHPLGHGRAHQPLRAQRVSTAWASSATAWSRWRYRPQCRPTIE